mgnify:CR=1 FL=1
MKTIVQNRSISLRFLPIRAVQTVEACPGKAFIYRIPHIRQDCKHIPHINMQLLFVSDMRKKSTGIAHCVRIREAVCQIMCRLSHLVIITHRQFLPFPQHAVHPVDKKNETLPLYAHRSAYARWSFNDKGPASFCCLCARSN